MALQVEWDKVEPQQPRGTGQGGKSSRKGKIMVLEANKTYRVRPLLKPVCYYRVGNRFEGHYRWAIVDDPTKNPIFEKYPKLKAQLRYATLVFDRGDGNNLKILEGPSKLFETFGHYKRMTKNEPGGPQSGDFQIQVVCSSGQKDRNTIYKVEFLQQSKFTEEERSQYHAKKADFDLIEMLKPHTLEEIENRLFRAWNDGQGTSGSSPSQTVAVTPQGDMGIEVDAGPGEPPAMPQSDENFQF